MEWLQATLKLLLDAGIAQWIAPIITSLVAAYVAVLGAKKSRAEAHSLEATVSAQVSKTYMELDKARQEEIESIKTRCAEDKAQLEKRIKALENEKETLHKEFEGRVHTLETANAELIQENNSLRQKIAGQDKRIASQDIKIDKQEKEIKTIRARMREVQAELDKRIAEASHDLDTAADRLSH